MNNTDLKNQTIGFIYKNLIKKVLFLSDPESVHDRVTAFGHFLGKHLATRKMTSLLFSYSNKKLEQNILGIKFPNPIGLSAGFDKDALLTDVIPAVGFGLMEVGSITGQPCSGNPRPRLWRLKKSKSLVVYYGLKNDGSEAIAKRLKDKKFRIPIGVSIAKTNSPGTVDTNAGVVDYVKAYRDMAGIGDYYTINISCPNTFGGEPFTDPARLEKLLSELDKVRIGVPTFIKLSPDLNHEQIDQILEVIGKHMIEGIICANLSKKRDNPKILDSNVPEKGGISGKVAEDKANEQIQYVYQKTRGRYIIIGCGGVFSAKDAYKKIRLGASLIQLITGMIFEGPQLIGEINRGLVQLLEKDGFDNISQTIGVDNKRN